MKTSPSMTNIFLRQMNRLEPHHAVSSYYLFLCTHAQIIKRALEAIRTLGISKHFNLTTQARGLHHARALLAPTSHPPLPSECFSRFLNLPFPESLRGPSLSETLLSISQHHQCDLHLLPVLLPEIFLLKLTLFTQRHPLLWRPRHPRFLCKYHALRWDGEVIK